MDPFAARTPWIASEEFEGGASFRRSALLSTCAYGTAATATGDSIAAVIDNRAGEVGVAVCSLASMSIELTQFGDSATLSKTISHLASRSTVEVLLPHTTVSSRLATALKSNLEECSFVAVDRKKFNETVGAHRLAELMSTADALGDVLNVNNYLCVAAGAALLSYIEVAQRCTLVPHTIRIKYTGLSDFLTIDRSAVGSLQLVRVSAATTGELTLVDAIDRTSTPMGRRLLRANVLQPPRNTATLLMRLQCTTFLTSHPHVLHALREPLRQLRAIDLERATATLSRVPQSTAASVESTIHALMDLCRVFDVVNALCGEMHRMSAAFEMPRLICEIHGAMSSPSFAALRDSILSVLEPEIVQAAVDANRASLQVQLCFAVRPNVSGLLDVARQQFGATLNSIFRTTDELKAHHAIPSLKLCHDARRGYYVTFDRQHEALAPPTVFLSRSRKGRRVSSSTEDLQNLNVTLMDLVEEILTVEGATISPLVATIRESIGSVQLLSEAVALLDLMISNASCQFVGATSSASVPVLLCGDAALKFDMRHAVPPLCRGAPMEANDFAITAATPVTVVTGPNASGKSTLLRALGQLLVLAHLGCLVPAASLSFAPCDAIYCRMSAAPNPLTASTFMHEMREMAHVVQHATNRSFVLIDELGTSTSSAEGSGIAAAVTEWVAELGCTTVIATHFPAVTAVASQNHRVTNVHFKVDTSSGNLRFSYKIDNGSCSIDRYGINLARALRFCNAEVVSEAEGGAARLERHRAGQLGGGW